MGQGVSLRPVPRQSRLREEAMIDLCGRCGHELDHLGEQCGHDVIEMHPSELTGGGLVPVTVKCVCPDGVRADVFACLQLSRLIELQQNTLTVLMFANGIEVRDG